MKSIRNIAIIAHVDHGKTTLVDCLLQQSGTLNRKLIGAERIMDSHEQERERGITILAKNTSIHWKNLRINIIDTPGHADFGGEVERVLSMVDSVLLLVDSVDGPMPQTRFVTTKAFECGLNPIVVVNKMDRTSARPDWVVEQVFDLFDALGANNSQLDFPVVYTSAVLGTAGLDPKAMQESMSPLFNTIQKHVPAPQVNRAGPLQLQISALDYNSYVGVIGLGRVTRGIVRANTPVTVVDRQGSVRSEKILKVMGYEGLERVDLEVAEAGDIVCVTGIDELMISDTLCAPTSPEGLPPLSIDEPTVSVTFQVNDSPFAGLEGHFVTSRNLKDRLEQELIHNVALRVEQGETPDKFKVSGRGELHLSVLIETMRREGFEMGVSRPEVILKEVEGTLSEPFEYLVIELKEEHQGAVIKELGLRRAELNQISLDGKGRSRLEFMAPARGLIGFRSQFLTITSGSGMMSHLFDHYGPIISAPIAFRKNGVLVSMANGKSLAYSLHALQSRGRLFIADNIQVYQGQIVGLHNRGNDLVVNPTKAKQLTNVRASGTDEALTLSPPISFSLEQALDFIADDELVEVTPNNIRLRKKLLREHERKRAARAN